MLGREIQIIPRTEVLRETGDNGYRDDPHLKNNILPKIITRTDIGMLNSVPIFIFFFVSPQIFFREYLSSIKGHVGLHIQAVEVQEQRIVRNTTQLVRNSSFLSGGTDY